jgi:colanic acid/amylovoran biosynthesis glycosyltransferase
MQVTTTLHVAYLVNQYPAVSHTFIKREIQSLERQGVKVSRFALHGWQGDLVDADDRAERELTRYLLQKGAVMLLLALIKSAFSAPIYFLNAFALTVRMSRGSDRNLAVHLAYLAEACLLKRWLTQTSVAHLHAHFATNPAEVASLLRALGGPPYSFTGHGSDITDRPTQMALALKVRHSAFVAAVCSFGRSQFMLWTAYEDWEKLKIVRCGLQADYGHKSDPVAANHWRLLCIGRLSKEKGQLLLIEAAARLHAQGTLVEITLVGDGPMRNEVEQKIEHYGLQEHVRLTGWLDAQAIENELRQARALVVSSISEGLPVVITEAMANRRPVIAPYLSGIPELVVHGETGWLVPAGDVQLLADAMQLCLQTPVEVLARMGETARLRVLERHNIDTEAGKLSVLFRQATSAIHESKVQ